MGTGEIPQVRHLRLCGAQYVVHHVAADSSARQMEGKYLARNKFVTRKMMTSSFPDFAKQHDTSRRNPMLVPLLLILLIVIVVGIGGVILLNPSPH